MLSIMYMLVHLQKYCCLYSSTCIYKRLESSDWIYEQNDQLRMLHCSDSTQSTIEVGRLCMQGYLVYNGKLQVANVHVLSLSGHLVSYSSISPLNNSPSSCCNACVDFGRKFPNCPFLIFYLKLYTIVLSQIYYNRYRVYYDYHY